MNPGLGDPGPIELILPTTGANAAIVRIVAATLAAHLDYGVDRIDDLRLVSGEVFSLLIELCQPADSLPLRIGISDSGTAAAIHLHSEGLTHASKPAPDGDLRWTLITALANDVQLQVHDGRFTFDIILAAHPPLPRPDD
ncbi:MAG: hypothetical protein ACKOW5_17020 [Actinomycetales bacterium]